jgi:hypothetical protein
MPHSLIVWKYTVIGSFAPPRPAQLVPGVPVRVLISGNPELRARLFRLASRCHIFNITPFACGRQPTAEPWMMWFVYNLSSSLSVKCLSFITTSSQPHTTSLTLQIPHLLDSINCQVQHLNHSTTPLLHYSATPPLHTNNQNDYQLSKRHIHCVSLLIRFYTIEVNTN